jgi:pimeloyl-ACP methyl ester carboxylesterase
MVRARGGIPTVLRSPSGSPSTPSTSVAPGAHPRSPWRRSSRWLRTWSRSWTTPVSNRRTTPAIRPAAALASPPCWIFGRLRSLLICCSTTCGDPYRHKLLGLRRRLYEQLGGEAYAQFRTLLLYPPYWINEHHRELAAEEARDTGDLGGAQVQASRLNAILAFDRRTEFHRIMVPTLVVGADDDLLAPRYFSEEYVRLIPGARAHFAARGGHALTKTEADLFNRIALEFFTELPA